jgi:site-specific DNA-methyltransferase (adenine-specific)
MAVRIEDAGFEIRDMIFWCYGQGFPKSKNLGDGFGSALKPATEPITLARKPVDGTLEASYAKHGTGGLNIDGCRVGTEKGWPSSESRFNGWKKTGESVPTEPRGGGRWPANLIHDGSDEVVAGFPEAKSGGYPAEGLQRSHVSTYGKPNKTPPQRFTTSEGSAARFFYCAKASKRDRDEGLAHMPTVTADPYGQHRGRRMDGDDTRIDGKPPAQGKNNHPTVKPTDLMRYLCRLITPPGGVVLDPFMGSGSTGKAAMLEGFQFIGIELSKEYFEISKARIEAAIKPAEPTTSDLFEDQK